MSSLAESVVEYAALGMAERYARPVAMVLDAYGLQIAYGDIP